MAMKPFFSGLLCSTGLILVVAGVVLVIEAYSPFHEGDNRFNAGQYVQYKLTSECGMVVAVYDYATGPNKYGVEFIVTPVGRRGGLFDTTYKGLEEGVLDPCTEKQINAIKAAISPESPSPETPLTLDRK